MLQVVLAFREAKADERTNLAARGGAEVLIDAFCDRILPGREQPIGSSELEREEMAGRGKRPEVRQPYQLQSRLAGELAGGELVVHAGKRLGRFRRVPR